MFSIVHSQYYYCLQESSEKIAVKLCRLELNAKNKDRWSREIQIMKKCVHLWQSNVYMKIFNNVLVYNVLFVYIIALFNLSSFHPTFQAEAP